MEQLVREQGTTSVTGNTSCSSLLEGLEPSMFYYPPQSVPSSTFEFSGSNSLFKNDDFFMDEDVDYPPVKMERTTDEGGDGGVPTTMTLSSALEGKVRQQHQQQLHHQQQLAQLAQLQHQLRQQQQQQQQGNDTNNLGDPGSILSNPVVPQHQQQQQQGEQQHLTQSQAANALFPVMQPNSTTAIPYARPILRDVITRCSSSESSSKPTTPTAATVSSQGATDQDDGLSTPGSQSRRMSQDMDDFNGTCYKSGPNTLLAVPTPVNHSSYMPPIMTLQQQLHQQQQRLLPPDLGSNGVDEDPAIRRAEQNRAAQRAFRQRKQQYIKWLESKAEELDEVYRIMALVRTENQQLCKLVIELNDQLQIATGSGRKYLDGSPTTTATSISSTPAKDKKITGTPPPSRTSPARAAAAVAAVASTGGLNGHGILDLSISREVSLRLMNLTMTPGTSLSGDRENGAVTRPKYQPRSSSISSGDVKGTHTKGKSAFKQSMQLKRQEQNHLSLLQNQHVMLQQQLQQQQHHQHHLQQQQHQNFGAITATTTAVPSTVAGNGNSNNSSGVIGNNTSPLFFNKCLTSSPTSTTLTPGSFVGPGDPQFPIAASSTVIGASAESPLRAALSVSVHGLNGTPSPLFSTALTNVVPLTTSTSSGSITSTGSTTLTSSPAVAAVGLQQQQQQLIAQQRYPYSHPSLLALQPEQMMPQQPPSSMFEANIPATLTGLVINTNSYVQGRSTIPSPRHNHLHHPYATAGYPLPGAQHQRVQSKPEQQQPLPSHQLTPQPIYFHPQSTLYQQQTPPALAHGMSGGGNGGGASHSVPPLHSKVAQTMWMDEEMTSPGKGRRSSMPILHLGSTPHHHQQQQKQSHHSLQQ